MAAERLRTLADLEEMADWVTHMLAAARAEASVRAAARPNLKALARYQDIQRMCIEKLDRLDRIPIGG